MKSNLRAAAIHLVDSFEDTEEDKSGVRAKRMWEVTIALEGDPASEPAPVYAVLYVESGYRIYYLGTLFDTGVIEANDWNEHMRRDRIPAAAVEEARRWLCEHAL